MVAIQHFFGAFCALVLSLLVGRVLYSPCVRRLFRNAALPGIPDPVAPKYAACSDEELIAKVSLVVTVKDTCAQAEDLLSHLAKIFPSSMNVYYAYPAIRGCRHVAAGDVGRKLFQNFTELAVGASDAPIAGFLKVQPMLTTKYAVLMHNDAYPMERDFACEMYRALEANPHYPIAAPQIYESAADQIIVPHGHHQNLHVRPSATGKGLRIDYDLSLSLLTQRKPEDFKEGPQVDFLEDHAFMARTDRYHELLDPSGSFTLEYMDMILNMRSRNTSAWYVPTARCIFDVDTNKITWEDLPYLVYKRSEQIGHQVRTYLSHKWGVEFVNTGIWNYVRYVMLSEVVLEGPGLPTEWKDQAAVFYSWFESVGFNRYNDQYLPDFIEEPTHGPVNISRTMKIELPTDVPAHRIPPKTAEQVLPRQQKKKAGAIDISFKEPHLPIGVRTSKCDASDAATYRLCGMAIQDGDSCMCYNYVVPFNLKTTLYLDKLMAWMKLPSRAFMYGQMKYWSVPINKDTTDMFCDRTQADCTFQVHFSENARVLQWSWFGHQPKHMFTNEGMIIGAALFLMLFVPMVASTKRVQEWFGIKKRQLRSLAALNAMVCNQAVRS
mmetsp:Transcript_79298/g.256362  ORF Transcript_79298/g.256362 Transcript_79298/m.256362 type:complete len:607 (+) Transcript_79298:60-1880(+)|eukprot:CAMPEP_0203968432 /NCGR_PEP_ID=MMETSP0359-20131031/96944_1 /ASSEMBLY_ACC=CAM_ASM_000338 /TAXON_ID=268821 /ORGANISM="Scrippsiella Hangoei, Strain SHTV-5" /LENGTH=606 /DNA_ID=CAMNT_0050906357 /DNA_START=64 /DNA_END=1884 /DNA_ORIENTATION=-